MKEEKNTEVESKTTETEKKRENLSVQVSPSEKRQITHMALKERGISISEFVRAKIFAEPQKISVENNETVLTDEEREMYEETINKLNAQIVKLKDDLVNFKVSQPSLGKEIKEEEQSILNELKNRSLIIEVTPKTFVTFNRIKTYRDEVYNSLTDKEKVNYFDFNKFLICLLLRGLRRSYYSSDLANSTGLNTDNVVEMAESENIDYDERV